MRGDTASDSTCSDHGDVATLVDMCLHCQLDAGQTGRLVQVDQSHDDVGDMCDWTAPVENILRFRTAYRNGARPLAS